MDNDWMPASMVDDCWIATGEGTCYDSYVASEHPNIQHVEVITEGPYLYRSYACEQCIDNLVTWGDTVTVLQ